MSSPSLYHGSPNRLVVGGVYESRTRRGEFYPRRDKDGLSVEEFVESFRPPEAPSRMKCIFAVTSRRHLNFAGASESFVYAVRPVGAWVLCHFGWFSALLGLVSDGIRLRKSKKASALARGYWSGKWAESGDDVGIESWEALCEGVQIVKKI